MGPVHCCFSGQAPKDVAASDLSLSEKMIRAGRSSPVGPEKARAGTLTHAATGCGGHMTGSMHDRNVGMMIAVCGGQLETAGDQAARW